MASSDLRPPNHKTVRKKKTRELPNLSDCHACTRRTNSTNPSDRLRILTSQWRIVLLCKGCYNLVQSAKLCSYCLTDLPAAEDPGADQREFVHQCPRCHRQVHRACVSRYSGFAPFSFLPLASGLVSHDFSVCIDCWVPRLLENRLRGVDSKGKMKVGSDSGSPGISRISNCHEKPKSPEEVVNEADCMAQKKALIADAAKEKAMRKSEVARRAVELANGAIDLGLLAQGREQSEKFSNASDLVDCDDEQLAFHLHRAMNSSPRIANTLHLCSNSCKSSTKVLKLNDDTSAAKLSRCLDQNLNTIESQAMMETSSSKSINVGFEDSTVNLESQSCQWKCEVICGLVETGRCSPERDRFFKKYSRKSSSNSKYKAV